MTVQHRPLARASRPALGDDLGTGRPLARRLEARDLPTPPPREVCGESFDVANLKARAPATLAGGGPPVGQPAPLLMRLMRHKLRLEEPLVRARIDVMPPMSEDTGRVDVAAERAAASADRRVPAPERAVLARNVAPRGMSVARGAGESA